MQACVCTAGRGQSHGDSESDSDGDEINRWNLRKCSAAGLDILSTVFGDELLPIVIPIVERRLQARSYLVHQHCYAADARPNRSRLLIYLSCRA